MGSYKRFKIISSPSCFGCLVNTTFSLCNGLNGTTDRTHISNLKPSWSQQSTDLILMNCFLIHSLVFTIKEITLSIEPNADVKRDTNVTLRCKALVSSSGLESLAGNYTIYKGDRIIYTKTASTTEDLLYPLPRARVSNSGKYKCEISIGGKKMSSQAQKLTVTGGFAGLRKEFECDFEKLIGSSCVVKCVKIKNLTAEKMK